MELKVFFGQHSTSEVHAMNEARIKFRDWYDEQLPSTLKNIQVSGSLTIIPGSFNQSWYSFSITVFVPEGSIG